MPGESKAGDFGTRLREARERKGVTLREIANATKISVRALEALEHNDLSRLPGGIFSRAFVRSYAVQAGLDPEVTVEDFVRQFPHESVTIGHSAAARVDEGDTLESDRRMASTALWLVGISVPLAGLLLYWSLAAGREPKAAPTPAAETGGVRQARGAANAPFRGETLTVDVIATRACSVSATVDARAPIEVRLDVGGRRTFEIARDLLLKVSDPAAIEWNINGAPARGLGLPGENTTVHLTVSNYRDFLTPR
jgi:transcriptional regulator with XRE-family HTH domain